MTIMLVAVRYNLPADVDIPCGEASDEGYRQMERWAADCTSSAERFAAPGENLLAAVVAGELAGVGGITVDPKNQAALRMCRCYARPAFRRHGVGWCLAEAVLAKARNTAHPIAVNAPMGVAARYREALGFVQDCPDRHTHALPQPIC
jgi:GNAT superfamily N-acetyltransferase